MSGSDSDSSEGTTTDTQTGELDAAYKLQLAVLDYLLVNGQKDPSLLVCLFLIVSICAKLVVLTDNWMSLLIAVNLKQLVICILLANYCFSQNARSFYIAQWYRDFALQCEKLASKQTQIDPSEIDDLEINAAQHSEAERKKKKLLVSLFLLSLNQWCYTLYTLV